MNALPRRLFWRVYLTLLASLVAVAFLMGASWWLMGEYSHGRWGAFHIHLSGPILPGPDGPPGAIAAAVDRLGEQIGGDISVYDADGALVASQGPPIALAAGERGGPAMRSPIMRVDLADGRVVLARPRPPPHPGLRIMAMALVVAGGVALAVYPIAGRLTRRLEGLRSGVEKWGAGALSLRVDDAGDDEVAVVARTFNAAASRVEDLLTSQKALLANASHELRSPLARLRMAIELWQERQTPEIHEEIVRNLGEIDGLVAEILLASRLNHGAPAARAAAPVDLVGLAAEEAARFEASLVVAPAGGGPIEVEGDATLLRRLIRNLLDNATKHGRPPIQIEVTSREAGARIVVSDHGEGIPPSERERVFEPFYRPAGHSEASGGWGLGLSLVRQIARRHGGAVFCEDEPGGGSRFVVDLGRAGEAAG
ncbi:MAG: sensor histidine kinase [Roseiarcus sp.]